MGEWRQVPGFSRYFVNELGDVRGRGGRILKTHEAKGYLVIGAWSDDGRRVKKGVHQLVALAFHGEPPSPQHEVAHWDGVRSNNAASNLRWATDSENAEDRIRHGTHPGRANHPRARLSEAQVASIQARYTGARGQGALLAAEFGVSKSHIRHIARGWRWPSRAGMRPAEIAQPSLHIEPALSYARNLAEAIWSKFYKADAPHWKPLDDVLGVLTQIDNMTSGLSRSPTTPTEGPAQTLTDEEIVAIRDDHLPSQGDRFDCIAFARAIESKVRASTLTDPEGAS